MFTHQHRNCHNTYVIHNSSIFIKMFSEYISSHSNLVWANVSAMYSVSDIGPTFWYCISFIRIFVMDICYMMILMRFSLSPGTITTSASWPRNFWLTCPSYKSWSLTTTSWPTLSPGCSPPTTPSRNCESEHTPLKSSFNTNIRTLSFGTNFRYWKSWHKP